MMNAITQARTRQRKIDERKQVSSFYKNIEDGPSEWVLLIM